MTEKKQESPKKALVEIVLEIAKKKPDLRIKGMNNTHPIYEALTALLRRQLKDNEVAEVIKDEESTRIAIVTDVFLEYIQPKYRSSLISFLKSGSSPKEIVSRGALYLCEDKRIQDSNILHKASSQQNSKLLMRALRKANPSHVYIESGEISRIEEKAKKIKKLDKIKYAAIVTLTGALILTGVYSIKLWRNSDKEEVYQKKQNELSSLELQLDAKKKEVLTLDEQISGKRKEYTDLVERVEETKRGTDLVTR